MNMKKIVVAVLVVVLTAGAAFAKGYEIKKKTGEYDVMAIIDKNPPVAGDNEITIVIRDAKGAVVKDAKVKVEYSMPAMPGMPAMNYKTDTMLHGNEYMAVMGLSMSGPWNIAVKITKDGKTSTMKFTVDAK